MSIAIQRAHSLPTQTVVSVSTSSTLSDSNKVALVSAASGSVTVTLPSPKNGLTVNVKKVDSSGYTVVVSPPSGTIDGAASKTISSQWDSLTITSDGTNWFLI